MCPQLFSLFPSSPWATFQNNSARRFPLLRRERGKTGTLHFSGKSFQPNRQKSSNFIYPGAAYPVRPYWPTVGRTSDFSNTPCLSQSGLQEQNAVDPMASEHQGRISHSSKGEGVHAEGVSRLRIWCESLLPGSQSAVFFPGPPVAGGIGRESGELSGASPIKALIPFLTTPPLGFHHLP